MNYLDKQRRCIEDIYKYEIDLAELEGDTAKVKQLEVERDKELRDNTNEKYQAKIDNAQTRKDILDSKIDNTSSIKQKNKYLVEQRKYIKEIYNNEIAIAEENGKTLEVKKLELEKEKELKDNTIAQLQNNVDIAESKKNLIESEIDSAITATSKNKLEKEKVKYIKQSYDYQIKIAKKENDTLKVSQLKVDKEKELLAVKKQILQNTLDQNEKEKELLDAKYQNATTAKDKNKIIDKRSKIDNKNVTAYRDSYNDAKKTLSSTSKSVNKTTSNAKSLSDSDRKKIDSYIQSGKVIPESLLKKVKAVDSNWYDTLVNYNNKYADGSSTLKAIKNSKVTKKTQDNLEKAINAGKTISQKTLDNIQKKDPALYKSLTEWNNGQDNRQNIIKKISSTKTLTSGDKKKIKSLVDGKKPISDSLLKKVASANPTLYAKLVKYNADLEYRDDTKYNLDVAVEKDKTQKRQDAKEKFDNIDQEYSMKVGLTDNKVKAIQDQVSLLEAKGMEVGSRLYTKQMELNQVNINRLTKEYSDQMKELSISNLVLRNGMRHRKQFLILLLR